MWKKERQIINNRIHRGDITTDPSYIKVIIRPYYEYLGAHNLAP